MVVNTSAPAPTITSFAASPTSVAPNGVVSLTAQFSGGTAIVTPGPYEIATTGGSINVTVTYGTTYTLTVTNADGVSVTRQVEVNTVPDPTISSFTANGNIDVNVVPGTQVTLRASYLNGTALITPGSISITSQGGGVGDAPTVTPSTTTTYVLTVTNTRNVSVHRSVTVHVITLPTITSFTRSPTGTVTPVTPKFGDHWSVSMEPKNHPPFSAETRFEIRPRGRPGLGPRPWISGDFSVIRALWRVRSISQSQRRIVRETSLAARY